MINPLSNGSAKVLVVEETGSGRQLISDVIRTLGFQDIIVAATGSDTLAVLEGENIDWILMPMMRNHPVNALHLLKLIADNPHLHPTRVSLISEAGDENYLDAAFALGLMSYHPRISVPDKLRDDLRHFLNLLKANSWRPVLAAADFMRPRLQKADRFQALVGMERNLLRVFPGSANLLLRLGEAQLLSGDEASGSNTLLQATIIDERSKGPAENLMQKMLKRHLRPKSEGLRLNTLGIKSCVVIDPDSSANGAISNLLSNAGVPSVQVFEDGEAAWRWLSSNPEPDLILQEWRLPALNGPMLLQRIRRHGFAHVPIVVISSVIKPQELPLLRELGVDNVIPKPFGQQLFFKNIVWTIQQIQSPTEQKSLERKVRKLLSLGAVNEAEKLRQVYMVDRRFSTAAKRQMDAEFAFHFGKFRYARDLALEALRLSGDSILLLTLIGKCLMKTGDYTTAAKFFEKAISLSPMNLEHLCNMAISKFESGEIAEAAAFLSQAKAIDPDCRLVNVLICQHAIIVGDIGKARTLLCERPLERRLLRIMNDRATAFIRSGCYDEGIRLYQRMLSSLPGEWAENHELVAYNLGLAFARFGDLAKAREQLERIMQRFSSPVQEKAQSLAKKIDLARNSGIPLPLFSDADEVSFEERLEGDASTDASSSSAPHTGAVCLKGILDFELSQDIKILLQGIPTYQKRESIGQGQI